MPDRLHPLLSRSGYSGQVTNYLFESLLRFDPESLELVPQLAQEKPKVQQVESGLLYTFRMRENAYWDSQSPVTGEDVLFTIKSVLNPYFVGGALRSFLDFVSEVRIEGESILIQTSYPYFLAESTIGTLPIFRASIYDPEGLFDQIDINRLTATEMEWTDAEVELLKRLAADFSSPDIERDTALVIGSGPYRIKYQVEDSEIVLQKKERYAEDTTLPKELHFQILPDEATAVTLFQNGSLDVLDRISPKRWEDLKMSLDTADYAFSNPTQLRYAYIALNQRKPELRDIRVRRALAHLLDVQWVIDQLLEGQASRMVGPFFPFRTYYNDTLPPIPFNPDRAKTLLDEVDQADLSFRYSYRKGNTIAQQIGQLLQAEARKLNVEITLVPTEFSALMQQYRQRDYDLIFSEWTRPPNEDDPFLLWHTASDHPRGLNRTGYGQQQTDQWIDSLRASADESVRSSLYQNLQADIYKEQPYIFLYSPRHQLIYKKGLPIVESTMRPGYFLH